MSKFTCTEFKRIRKVDKVDGVGFKGILLYNWQMYLLLTFWPGPSTLV